MPQCLLVPCFLCSFFMTYINCKLYESRIDFSSSSSSSTSDDTLPRPAAFYDTTAKQTKIVAGHQAKFTAVLRLVFERDRHDETKG